ncbi:hypothetical protein Mpet_0875 [Methanolacinia petrolearia DSM 11571]|uniref:Uncharacterized protein n=1 Tax=Methanolacinia petrolearia (strain DSM 11571 / OCM 486 / SEBR 4847) TaxID=679926 RepID=E1RJC6_METP4|nr:hypothetical protein Mpet_0875 [Methanolacinia petrolearia DSM 11571]
MSGGTIFRIDFNKSRYIAYIYINTKGSARELSPAPMFTKKDSHNYEIRFHETPERFLFSSFSPAMSFFINSEIFRP